MRRRLLKFVVVTAAASVLLMPAAEAQQCRPTPSDCVTKANWPHKSHYYDGAIGYGASIKCKVSVPSATVEMWGDRHTWTGWRQHTPGHAQKTRTYVRHLKMSQHPRGHEGTYSYRTRAIGWVQETSGTYRQEATSATRRITCHVPGLVAMECF